MQRNIVILISGQGSNMRAIVQACVQQRWQAQWGVAIAAVVSNRADAAGLRWAQQQGLATAVVEHAPYPQREDFERALMACIDGYAPTLVVLAGFMRVLGAGFVQHYSGRLLNIHPSLLPAFPGLNTHRRALDAGCCFAGATVHEVTEGLDAGPIVGQVVVPVLSGDTAETLAARVLSQEHKLYAQCILAYLQKKGNTHS